MKNLLRALLISFLSLAGNTGYGQVITTIVGGGDATGHLAINTSMCPTNVAVDTFGNLFMTCYSDNRIWKVNTSGIISLIAGTSAMGFSGDGGPATAATLNAPYGIAVDRPGNVYFADSKNHRIRKISTSGIISTMAGTGTAGYTGDGGPAIAADIDYPTGLAVDTLGNLYLADANASVIRYITGGIIRTVAGGGVSFSNGIPATAAKIADVYGIAVDKYMNLYIAEGVYDAVQKVDPSGIITTIAGGIIPGFSGDGGPATNAYINDPQGLAVDNAGNIYISDSRNARVRHINPSGIIRTWAGNGISAFSGDGGAATNAALGRDVSVAMNKTGDLFIIDENCRVRKVTPSGTISTYAGGGIYDGGPATATQLMGPTGVAFDPAGNMFVSDVRNNRVRKITPSGIITTYAGSGICSNLWGGGYSGDGGPATAATLNYMQHMVTDAAGNLYIADAENNRIRKVDAAGTITTFAGTGIAGYNGDLIAATAADIRYPVGIAIDPAGNVYFSENRGNRIRKVNTSGIITTFAGTGIAGYTGDGGPATAARVGNLWGICTDKYGNLLMTTYSSNTIRFVDPAGKIYTLTGDGTPGTTGDGGPATAARVYEPIAITTDNAGNIYFNSGSTGIRKIDAAGIISTYAGNGIAGYTGDGMMATASSLNFVSALAVDGGKNLHIADNGNNRIRRIGYNHSPGFAGAHTFNLLDCSGSYGIDTLLAVVDSNLSQTITWQVVAGPSHGSIATTYSAASTGGLVSPSGFAYARATGYSGSDVITIKVSDGIATDVVTISFNVVQQPDAGTITGANTFCTGSTDILTNTATGGVWSSSGPEATVSTFGSVTGMMAGTAVISYTVTNLCGTAVSTYDITVIDCPNGIKSAARHDNSPVSISPNPNKGTFTVYISSPLSEPADIKITDMAGRKIMTMKTTTNKSTDIKLQVAKGVYFLTAETFGGYYNREIIVGEE